MFEVRAGTTIGGDRSPFVIQNFRFRTPRIHHGLDRQHHTFAQPRIRAARAKVGDLRLLVQLGANAVPHKLTHHAEAICLDVFLYRGANVAPINNSPTKAVLSNIVDLNGNRIELAELPPESLHAQATERWH